METNPYDVVHFCVKVRTGTETWEGNAFYAKPAVAAEWSALTSDMMKDLWNALPEIVDTNLSFRLSLEADSYTVHGLMADSMRLQRDRVVRGERPPFTWDPIMVNSIRCGRRGVYRGK